MASFFPGPLSSPTKRTDNSLAQGSPMPSKSSVSFAAILLACVFAGIFTGCRSSTVPDSVLPRLAGNEPQMQLDFWHEVATRLMISNDEAFHGLLLYVDG